VLESFLKKLTRKKKTIEEKKRIYIVKGGENSFKKNISKGGEE
jgi:hypothetical protein